MKKQWLILLLTTACHGLGYAATPAVEGGEPARPSRAEPQAEPQAERQADPTVGKDNAPAAPVMPPQPGAVNPANGQYFPPAGNGDVINPATGERYIGTSGGYINPNTGEFMPKIR